MPRSRIRLLCDQNVAQQYIDGFRAEDGFQATTVGAELDVRAADADIAADAATNEYVVFTSDDDFFALDAACGRIHYSQEAAPGIGDVVAAVRRIAATYDDHSEIIEHVPDGWI